MLRRDARLLSEDATLLSEDVTLLSQDATLLNRDMALLSQDTRASSGSISGGSSDPPPGRAAVESFSHDPRRAVPSVRTLRKGQRGMRNESCV